MSGKSLIRGAAAFILAAAVLAAPAASQQEDSSQAAEAASATVIELLKEMSDTRAAVREAAEAKLTAMGRPVAGELINYLSSGEGGVRAASAKILGKLGPEIAGEAVPELIEALEETSNLELQKAAAEALSAMGIRALEPLIKAVKSSNDDGKINAARAIGMIGPPAAAAVPILTKALKDSEHSVSKAAMEALGKIGPGAKKAVPQLAKYLSSEDADLRGAAVKALGDIGPDSRQVVNKLIPVLDDSDWDLRKAAAETLGKIGPDAVPALMKALREEGKGMMVGNWAAHALRIIGRGAKEAVPELISMLEEKDLRLRLRAVTILGKTGPAGEKALPLLSSMLREQNTEEFARALREAIDEIGSTLNEKVVAREQLKEEAQPLEQLPGSTQLPIQDAPAAD